MESSPTPLSKALAAPGGNTEATEFVKAMEAVSSAAQDWSNPNSQELDGTDKHCETMDEGIQSEPSKNGKLSLTERLNEQSADIQLNPSNVEMQSTAEVASPSEAFPAAPQHQRPPTPAPKALSKATRMANLHEVFKAANEANMRILGAIPKIKIPPPPTPSCAERVPAAAGSPSIAELGLAAAGNPDLESIPL
jgi:hypothetical protein